MKLILEEQFNHPNRNHQYHKTKTDCKVFYCAMYTFKLLVDDFAFRMNLFAQLFKKFLFVGTNLNQLLRKFFNVTESINGIPEEKNVFGILHFNLGFETKEAMVNRNQHTDHP